MQNEFDQFNDKEAFIRYEENLKFKIQSPNITDEEKVNYKKQMSIMKLMSNGANKVGSMAGDGLKSVFSNVSSVSGSALHETVYGIGKFFGHNFGPWEAVRISSKIGKFAKFGVPVICTTIELAQTIRQDRKEEKRWDAIRAAKLQFNEEFRKSIGNVRAQLENEFSRILGNYNKVLDDINNQKINLISLSQKNKQLIQTVKEIDAEYVDFIEILDNKNEATSE